MMLVGVSAWAQEGFNQYLNQPPGTDNGLYSGHQWRPVDGQYSYKNEGIKTFRGGAEILPSQSQPVMLLPPGTYRPIEDANTTPPQVGAYRFRTVSPDEQSRIEKQERMRIQEKPAPIQSKFRFRGNDSAAVMWPSNTNYQQNFRQDGRFTEKTPQQSFQASPYNSSQSYSPSYMLPNFRQDNRER
jgi:hypothetical protein